MFVPVDVIITPRNITIDIIVDRLEHSEIDLEPVFQKRGGVWTEVQKARLIETLLLKYRVKGRWIWRNIWFFLRISHLAQYHYLIDMGIVV